MANKRVTVIGKTGQVARALADLAPSSQLQYHFADRTEADLLDRQSLTQTIADHAPNLCINAAAYTAVDKAERERELAMAVNAIGPTWLAEICQKHDIPLIHLSTDCVFSGSNAHPYLVDAPIDPINTYGLSKATGEMAVRIKLAKHVIIRLAWVFSEYGNNFLQTMLRIGRSGSMVHVVSDQIGPPSYAADIARGLDSIASHILVSDVGAWGTYHLTNSGAVSRFGFAKEIFRLAEAHGYPAVKLEPIASSAFPTPAQRPPFSILDCTTTTNEFGVTLRPWQDGLKECTRKLFGMVDYASPSVS